MTAADELRALSAAATEGPWYSTPAGSLMSTPTKAPVAVTLYGGEANRALIMWLVNHASDLADLIEWAGDAPHHDGCSARFNDDPEIRNGRHKPYPCKCGRDSLTALEADRA